MGPSERRPPGVSLKTESEAARSKGRRSVALGEGRGIPGRTAEARAGADGLEVSHCWSIKCEMESDGK